MFDELGAVNISHQNRRHKWLINFLHQVDGAFALGSNHDAVGFHQVGYRATFTQKFRITDHVEACAVAVISFD